MKSNNTVFALFIFGEKRLKKMKRRTFDGLASLIGLMLAVILLIAAGLLNWGAGFASDAVSSQLVAQKITIPSSTQNSDEAADVTAYFKDHGGKLLTTGKDAQMYADHYLGFHLSKMPTYADASTASRSASSALAADPTNADLQKKADSANALVDTVFKGTTLRGTLLTAYAFGTLGSIAGIAAWSMGLMGLLFLLLALLGYLHLRRTDEHAAI